LPDTHCGGIHFAVKTLSLVLLAATLAAPTPAQENIRHRFLCVDNGKNQLLLVDQLHPDKSWSQPIPSGSRDIQIVADGKVSWFVGGKKEHPGIGLDFFSGWDTLANGNIVVANWLGHGKQGKGCHLAEFTPDNKLVWTWQGHTLARQVTNVKMLE
jgi:hypothetical protein